MVLRSERIVWFGRCGFGISIITVFFFCLKVDWDEVLDFACAAEDKESFSILEKRKRDNVEVDLDDQVEFLETNSEEDENTSSKENDENESFNEEIEDDHENTDMPIESNEERESSEEGLY